MTFPPDLDRRIQQTVACKDCDALPKVSNAGSVFIEDGRSIQLMHNGVKIIQGCYYGSWMTEIIRLLKGHNEPQEELVFHHILNRLNMDTQKPIMMELGAFWSYYSLWFLNQYPDSATYMIEPDPHNLEIGKLNFILNNRVGTFLQASIGKEAAPPTDFFCEFDSVFHPTPTESLESLFIRFQLSHVDILLADIQGAEVGLLEGAVRLLEEKRVRFLLISTHHQRMTGDPLTHQHCLKFLQEKGAYIIAEHSISESVSGDGLIAVSFEERDKDFKVSISHARARDTLFGEIEFQLALSEENRKKAEHSLAVVELGVQEQQKTIVVNRVGFSQIGGKIKRRLKQYILKSLSAIPFANKQQINNLSYEVNSLRAYVEQEQKNNLSVTPNQTNSVSELILSIKSCIEDQNPLFLKNQLDAQGVLQKNLVASWILLQKNNHIIEDLNQIGFRVFSQSNEDGLLLYIFTMIGTTNKLFVEIGANCDDSHIGIPENNTSNLIVYHGWNGLIIDGDQQSVDALIYFFSRCKNTKHFHWQDRKSKCKDESNYINPMVKHQFITVDNINEYLLENKIPSEIDLLSIDIDGMDYHIWEAINITSPRVVVIEFNQRLNFSETCVPPNIPEFQVDTGTMPSDWFNYIGCSLNALLLLAKEKNYRLVAVTSSGFNAVFMRNDIGTNLFKTLTGQQIRESALWNWVDDSDFISALDYKENNVANRWC